MSESKADVVLDVRGLTCPMPVLKMKKAIDGMEAGQTLQITATDSASKVDVPAFLYRVGHELVETREDEGVFSFLIKKNGDILKA